MTTDRRPPSTAEGIRHVREASRPVLPHIRARLPSCVPSTAREATGARIDAAGIRTEHAATRAAEARA